MNITTKRNRSDEHDGVEEEGDAQLRLGEDDAALRIQQVGRRYLSKKTFGEMKAAERARRAKLGEYTHKSD